jgi:predicted metal-dependent HD superfamily phosphohydrolase
MSVLQQLFIETATKYTTDNKLVEGLWAEIENHYSGKKRYYHNLSHLQNLLTQLTIAKSNIQDWDAIVFSLFYHDIVYNTLKQDNEEKSAELAGKRLAEMHVPEEKITKCKQQILATKGHAISAETDTNLFTDADLSILGQPSDIYKEYCAQIRKEYSAYPDILYNPGRKKVLAHFLKMDRIFKTEVFFDAFEAQARKNICEEMRGLGE